MKLTLAIALCTLLILVAAAAPSTFKERTFATQDEDADWTDYVQFISGLVGYIGDNGDVFDTRGDIAIEKRVSKDWTEWLIFVAGLMEYFADNEPLFSKRAMEQLPKRIAEISAEHIQQSERLAKKGVPFPGRIDDVINKRLHEAARASSDDDDQEWTDYMSKVAAMLNLVAASGNMFSRDAVTKERTARSVDDKQKFDEKLEDYLQCVLENPEAFEEMTRRLSARNVKKTDTKRTEEFGETVVEQTRQDEQVAESLTMNWADYLYMIAGILRMIATGGSIFD